MNTTEPITNSEAENILLEWAEDYYDTYGLTSDDISDMHCNCQRTSTLNLINATLNFTSKEKLAEVIALLCDANAFRTMDIMGICRHLINNDTKFEETYKA